MQPIPRLIFAGLLLGALGCAMPSPRVESQVRARHGRTLARVWILMPAGPEGVRAEALRKGLAARGVQAAVRVFEGGPTANPLPPTLGEGAGFAAEHLLWIHGPNLILREAGGDEIWSARIEGDDGTEGDPGFRAVSSTGGGAFHQPATFDAPSFPGRTLTPEARAALVLEALQRDGLLAPARP